MHIIIFLSLEAFLKFNGFSSLCNFRYEGALDPWLLSMWKSLNEINPSLLPRVSDINDPNLSFLGDPKVHVIYYSSNEVTQDPMLLGMNDELGIIYCYAPFCSICS